MRIKPFLRQAKSLRLLLPLFGISMSFLVACGGNRANDAVVANSDTLSIALEQVVNNAILPAVEGFAEKSARFSDTAINFCNVSDAVNLNNLQKEWKELSTQWYELAVFNFGPLNDDIIFPKINFIDSLRQRGIDYTETVRTEINNGIASSETLDVSFFRSKDFNRVGLLPLELLSFETSSSEHFTTTVDVLAEYQTTPRKCDYLKGMAAFNLENANYVRNGWQVNYLNTDIPYRTLFSKSQLDDDEKPVPLLLISIQQHLDYLAKRNIVTLGAKVANNSYDNIKSSVDVIGKILNGEAIETNTTTISFFDIMSSAGAQNSIAIVEDNLAAINLAIQNTNSTQLNASMALLDGNFKREITQGLDVELGINFSDGD
ncbi:MAG: putative lipoprotein [Cocleimonas sp.]|jgi:predicted lipoprotein